MSNNKFKNSNDTSIEKEEKLGSVEAVSPATVDAAESTSANATTGKDNDSVADAINKHSKRTEQNSTPNSSNKPFGKKHGKNASKNKNSKGSNPGSGSASHSKSEAVNTPSSSVTKTKVNDFMNFSEALNPQYETTGWRQLADERSIFQKLNDAFMDSGVMGASTIDHRGDLNKNFRNWAQVLKNRPLNTNHAYVLDHFKSDKSMATENMIDRFYLSRRPYRYLSDGVPTNNMTKFSDVMYNVKFLNVSTNYHTPQLLPLYRRAATYGNLEQDLNSNHGYQSRMISVIEDSIVNSLPGHHIGFRYPSGNENYLRSSQPINPENELNSYSINLINNDRTIDGPVNMSLELQNKTKTIRKLFSKIQDEASKYAAGAGSGDNSWFSPAFLIADEQTLAATINSPADLKTFLYIINDAIQGAFRSQLLLSTKVGAPDSTFIGLTSKNTAFKTQFDEAYSDIWSYFKHIPMHRDVIDKWNQYKHWSKLNEENLYDAKNTLQIPCFMLMRAGGGYYADKAKLTEIKGTVRPKEEHAQYTDILNTLTYSGQTLDGAAMRLPQGDWYAFFIQNVMAKLSMESFIRLGKSNALICNTEDRNYLSGAANTQINANTLKTKVAQNYTDASLDAGSPIRFSGATTRYIQDLPHTINGSKASNADNENIVDNYGNDNLYFDMLISYHTVTGFMAAFMELIVNMSIHGDFNNWKQLLRSTTPFFSRLATLVDSDDAFVFNTAIEYPSLMKLPTPFSEIPKTNILHNIDYFYPKAGVTTSNLMSWEPTRYNLVSTEWNDYHYAPYKVLGLRYSMLDTQGKADRDVQADNILATVFPANTQNVSNIWRKNHNGANTYMVSHTILRPNAYMALDFVGRIGATQTNFFPIYIGNHIGNMFNNHNDTFMSANNFVSGGQNVSVAQLEHRSLLLNSSDDLVQSGNPGAFTQSVKSQIQYDFHNFMKYTGCPFMANQFVHNNWMTAASRNQFNCMRLISMYGNNSQTNVIDEIFNLSYDRFNISDPKCISTLTFNVI